MLLVIFLVILKTSDLTLYPLIREGIPWVSLGYPLSISVL